jgi:hypothetical protein
VSSRRRPDTVSLILGLLTTVLAAGGLWVSLGGEIAWSTVKIAAPLVLVLIGIIGLAASRPRS